jgi:hypothetical protein
MKPRAVAAPAPESRAVHGGDSSAATLVLLGELLATSLSRATQAYRPRQHSALGPLAVYRRARIPSAWAMLPPSPGGIRANLPCRYRPPDALYVLGDAATSGPCAARRFGELFTRYPADLGLAGRFRLAAQAAGWA